VKKPEVYLKEYCQRLPDENIKFLAGRFSQKLSGDMAEVFQFLSNVREIDKWLSSAQNSEELFYMVDLIQSVTLKEAERRVSVSGLN
jgi:hypothetical protein